ncbi:MAG: hypothetical protein MJ175_03740 [Clostridia bacterium]|nr:hypothetical protein [Clostridia bacterium]
MRYTAPYRAEAVLALLVNDIPVTEIPLNTVQCHGVMDNGQLDDGVRSFTECTVCAEIAPGDRITLVNRIGVIGIDLIDLELAPPPAEQPKNTLSVTDFGTDAAGNTDAADALEACFSAAAAQGKHVFLPAGTYLQSRRIKVPAGLHISGAGAFYTHVEFITPGRTFSDTCGYALDHDNVITGIHFNDRTSHARDAAGILFHPFGSDQRIEDCHFSNVGCVFGWDRESCHTVMRRCRVIGTYFDGTHWGDGRYADNELSHNFFRGLGDDAIAQVNRTDMGLCESNYAHHNTIIASYWGRGISDVGGNTLTLRANYVDSTYLAGLIVTTEQLGPSPSRPINGLVAEDNLFLRCGHRMFDDQPSCASGTGWSSRSASNHAAGHFSLMTNTMSDIVLRRNIIADGATYPVWFDETGYSYDSFHAEDTVIRGYPELPTGARGLL